MPTREEMIANIEKQRQTPQWTSLNVGGLTVKNPAIQNQQNEFKQKLAAETAKRLSERNVESKYKQEITNLGEYNRQLSRIQELNDLAGKADFGPYYSKLMESALPQIGSGGEEVPPGYVGAFTNYLLPDDVQNYLALKNKLLESQKIGFQSGGKSFTGTEKGISLGSLPSLYTDKNVFLNALGNYKSSVQKDLDQNRALLQSVGYSPEKIKAIETNINSALSSQPQKQGNGGADIKSLLQASEDNKKLIQQLMSQK